MYLNTDFGTIRISRSGSLTENLSLTETANRVRIVNYCRKFIPSSAGRGNRSIHCETVKYFQFVLN